MTNQKRKQMLKTTLKQASVDSVKARVNAGQKCMKTVAFDIDRERHAEEQVFRDENWGKGSMH